MKLKNIIYISLAGVLTLTSCNSLLDIPQKGVLNFDTFYRTDEDAEAAIIACYSQLRNLEFSYRMGKEMLTDDFWAGGGARNDNADLEQLNEFTFGTDQTFLRGMFESYYGIIYKANVVLGHVTEETEIMRRARAEAKIFRAWAYFELITMWGNPPFVDHELEPSEYARPNGTTEELWGLVERDLTEAISSGSLTEKSSVNDKTWRVTKQFAQAILGKAYLWQKKNGEAAQVFNDIVDSQLYDLYSDYENILVGQGKQNCESIFESIRVDNTNNPYENFGLPSTGYNTVASMCHWRTGNMDLNPEEFASMGWGFLNPTRDLYDDFVKSEGTDGYRLNATLKTYAQMQERNNRIKAGMEIINEGYFMWKWRILRTDLPAAMDNSMAYCNNPRWMRFAEVLLCGAEANLLAGNQDKADAYYNRIRTRAQAATKSGVSLEDIKLEKRVEMCGEGTRFQDLVRWGDAENKLKNNGEKTPYLNSNGDVRWVKYNGDDTSRYGFKPKHKLLPYPGEELRLNKMIKQNPGW
ncbi:MAG: RagB/SusD family nutrient uptake outer membrane protein [Bacteroidales bacterium]|nr:RagB/SusD family nutrient uptake outer membrane protein [Bacteroidales bacterium]